jgi:hypothetical protein
MRGYIAVVIPASSCPCGQVDRVLQQLSWHDTLVVVWNGRDHPHDCVHRQHHRSLKWISFGTPIGAGRARNIGVASLSRDFDLILFCDADDQVTPNWVASLCAPLLGGSADIVGGILHAHSKKGVLDVVAPEVVYWHEQAVFGGNCGFTRDAWSSLQGFDPMLKCCEDTDIAWRGAMAGLRVRVVTTAIVEIFGKAAAAEFMQRFGWGFWATQLLRKHHVGFDHLPSFKTLWSHISHGGYATHPLIAVCGQSLGYRWGRYTAALR